MKALLFIFAISCWFAVADSVHLKKRENEKRDDVICPPTWQYSSGSCYKNFQTAATWSAAKKACVKEGKDATGGSWIGKLAEPRGKVTYDYLKGIASSQMNDNTVYWLGAKAPARGQMLKFDTDKEDLPKDFNWGKGEPSTYTKSRSCLVLTNKGFGDRPCGCEDKGGEVKSGEKEHKSGKEHGGSGKDHKSHHSHKSHNSGKDHKSDHRHKKREFEQLELQNSINRLNEIERRGAKAPAPAPAPKKMNSKDTATVLQQFTQDIEHVAGSDAAHEVEDALSSAKLSKASSVSYSYSSSSSSSSGSSSSSSQSSSSGGKGDQVMEYHFEFDSDHLGIDDDDEGSGKSGSKGKSKSSSSSSSSKSSSSSSSKSSSSSSKSEHKSAHKSDHKSSHKSDHSGHKSSHKSDHKSGHKSGHSSHHSEHKSSHKSGHKSGGGGKSVFDFTIKISGDGDDGPGDSYFYMCELLPQKLVEETIICDNFPEKIIPNSLRPSTFLRTISTVIPMACKLGYKPSGGDDSLQVDCRKGPNGKPVWFPCGQCQPIDPYCQGNPSDKVKNAAKLKKGSWTSSVGDVITLNCDQGFSLTADSTVLQASCSEKTATEGDWVIQGACQGVDSYCDEHPWTKVARSDTLNSKFSRTLGTTVNLSCKKGYRPKTPGKDTVQVTCTPHVGSKGEWDAKDECQEIPDYCDARPHSKFLNAQAVRDPKFPRTLGSQVNLDCQFGYAASTGDSVIATCSSLGPEIGEWTSEITCIRIVEYCDTLPHKSVINSETVKAGTFTRYVGSEVNLQCQQGKVASPSGTITAKCTSVSNVKGTWFSSSTCDGVDYYCSDTPHAAVANVQAPKAGSYTRKLGATVSLQCWLGYLPNVGQTVDVSCTSKTSVGGEWTTLQFCKQIEKYCDDHPEKVTTHVATPAKNTFTRKVGDTAPLRCEQGYQENLTPFIAVCKGSSDTVGVWNSQSQCNPIPTYCDDHPEKATSRATRPSSLSQTIGSRVELGCLKGYSPGPNGVIATCRPHTDSQGVWGVEGECVCTGKREVESGPDSNQAAPAPATTTCKRFIYAAVRNGNVCSCDYSYGKYGPANDCNIKCTGSNEVCGGNMANNLYKINGRIAEHLGCYKDNLNLHDLDGYMTASDQLTVENCVNMCAEKGYSYAGVQNGNLCFCGKTFGKYGRADQCSTKCTGSEDTCGGLENNQLYTLMSEEGKWSLLGCYRDNLSSPDLTGSTTSRSLMSIQWCTDYCYSKACESKPKNDA